MAQTAMAEFYVRRGSQTSSVVSHEPSAIPHKVEDGYGDDFVGRLNRNFARSAVSKCAVRLAMYILSPLLDRCPSAQHPQLCTWMHVCSWEGILTLRSATHT